MTGSNGAATRPTAASTAFTCARPRARCSASSPASAPNLPPLRSKASIPPMRTACSTNWNQSRKTFAMPSKSQPASLPERSSAMADPVLKFPPEQKGNPASPVPRPKLAAEPRRRLMAGMRRYRRFLLLVLLPLVAAIAGFTFYLNGGRYVTTDDAYVGAQKVLITSDVSGKIIKVTVKEGQQVSTGDTLFQIDPVPFQLALAQARAKLEDAKTSHSNLVTNVAL